VVPPAVALGVLPAHLQVTVEDVLQGVGGACVANDKEINGNLKMFFLNVVAVVAIVLKGMKRFWHIEYKS